MEITPRLLELILLTGATWILWLLIGLSVVSLSVILERAHYFVKSSSRLEGLAEELVPLLEKDQVAQARQLLFTKPGLEARVLYEGLRAWERGGLGPDGVAEVMAAAKTRERRRLEARLAFLGTLGNNAPFIGLLGTVIGIIKAFHSLSLDSSGPAQAVMAGISEALVATAMGLFVAIPAVIAFNYFQRRIRHHMAAADEMVHLLLAQLRRAPSSSSIGARVPPPAQPFAQPPAQPPEPGAPGSAP
jgi:biopolymer transport protein ExbB